MDFVNSPRDPIGRREFSLLQTSFDVNVLALLVRHRNVCDFVVKNQAVPVGVRLRLLITPREMIRLAETEIDHLRAGREVSKVWLWPPDSPRARFGSFAYMRATDAVIPR